MGQQEIMDLLKKDKNRIFTSMELSRITKVNNSSITRAVKILRETNDINYKVASTRADGKSSFLYWYKRTSKWMEDM